FSFYTPQQFDVLIDEIMADPTPLQGLPNAEWIELKNTSAFAINLQGWRIGKPTGQSGGMPNFILKPDSFIIVCTGSAVPALSVFGPTITVTSFPSLDNDGDQLSITNAQGKTIHAVKYSIDWYQNQLKKDGGWTLEMIDTKNPCSGFLNWKASGNLSGGTPGKKNSVDGTNTDQAPPQLIRATATDSVNITLIFDEPLDSLKASVVNNYLISDGLGNPQSVTPLAPLFDRVNLRLTSPLQRNKVYTVTVTAVTDCKNNSIGSKNTSRVGLTSVADSFDVIINEVLFNPKPTQVDYVEIYNRSNKIIDLKQLSIANRSSTNVLGSIRQLSSESLSLFPGEFMVLTEEPGTIKQQFIIKNPDAFLMLTSMPSFPDDKGTVVLLNVQGNVVDELKYDEKWHFALIDNREGVSLERIDYNAATQNKENFHSAATSAGYGTPGYVNSQFRLDLQVQGDILVTPEIVSPDNDGMDDFATISYSFPESGYVAKITIFDASGRPVRYVQRSALSSQKGSYRWDGLGEKSQKLNVGIYVILTEIFDLKGKRKQFKNTIVLARRF
ncbi:MAG: lamin tail domain-containing protein, partial [Chitinophagaceae bacterium]